MFKFIRRLFLDLFLACIPRSNTQISKLDGFAFIVHPRDYGDVVNNVGFLKKLPKSFVVRYFHYLWPFTVSKIKGVKRLDDGRDIPGWVIGVPIFAHEMMEDRRLARKKIARAVNLAVSRGARVVGLGGLTGSMTEGGAGLSEKNGVIITAGRAYTSFVVKSYLDDVISRFDLARKDVVVAVVGAAGGVGTAFANLILSEGYKKIILIDLERKLDVIYKRFLDMGGKPDHIEITHTISAVRDADVIITVTNAPEAVVENDDIRSGAIIIDDAQPSDISPEIISSRDDIIVIEAGVISATENIKVGTNFRLANPHEVYCCLCEAMAIAASDWTAKYEPRDITAELINEVKIITERMGFTLAPYQAYGKIIPQERIKKVRSLVRKRLYDEDLESHVNI